MKKILSALLCFALIFGSLIFVGCDTADMRFLSIKYINRYEKRDDIGEIRKSLSYISKFDSVDEAYVCILKNGASGDIVIPEEHDGHPVVYVTAEKNADNSITSLTVPESVRYLEHVCSYREDNPSLTSCSLPEGITIRDCFNYCINLEDVSLQLDKEAEKLEDCFNHCNSLESFAFNEPLTEINNCFNCCDSLKKLEFKEQPELIRDSFNFDPLLSDITKKDLFMSVDSSFGKCAVSVEGKVQLQQETSRICSKAIEKLIDAGVISKPDSTFYQTLNFNKDGSLAFNDKKAGSKLSDDLHIKLDNVILTDEEHNPFLLSQFRKNLVEGLDDCHYIIHYQGYVSNEVSQEYRTDSGQFKTLNYQTVTTLVFVIDRKTGDIIHIHSVGSDTPQTKSSFTTADKVETSGKVLSYNAFNYISKILQ